MRKRAISLMCLMAGAFAGIAVAQPARGPSSPQVGERGRQSVIGPGFQHNIIAVERVMGEIHQLMFQGQFTPNQATEVTEMMTRLGIIMREMSGPESEKLAEKHEQELKEIRRQIGVLRQQLKESK